MAARAAGGLADVVWREEDTMQLTSTTTVGRPTEEVYGADVPNSGEVRFVPAPGGRGTELHVTLG
jgi:uncharacterized membrane protein